MKYIMKLQSKDQTLCLKVNPGPWGPCTLLSAGCQERPANRDGIYLKYDTYQSNEKDKYQQKIAINQCQQKQMSLQTKQFDKRCFGFKRKKTNRLGISTVLWMLGMVAVNVIQSVQAQGIILEIGNLQVSNCNTFGEIMEFQRGLFANTWDPNFIVGGRTTAQSELSSNPAVTGCTTKEYAFFKRYLLDAATQVPVLSFTRIYGDFLRYNNVAHYFNSIAAIRLEYSSTTQNGLFYVVAIKFNTDSTDAFGGTMIQFYDASTNIMLKSTILDLTHAPPEQQTAYLMNENPLMGNQNVRFEYAVNNRNKAAPLFPAIHTVNYLHYAATPKIQFQNQQIAQNTMLGVTAFYKEVDIELRGAALHYNNDLTKDLIPAIYYSIRGVAAQQSQTEHICCSANTPGYAIDSFTFDQSVPNTISKVAYAAALPLAFPSLGRYLISSGGIGHLILYTIEFAAAQQTGCQHIQPFVKEIFTQHQTQFYAEIKSFSYSHSGLLRVVMTVAQTEAQVGFIGTENHHIQELLIEKFRCYDAAQGYFLKHVGGVYSTPTYLQGKSSHSVLTVTDEKNNATQGLTSIFFGAACKSGVIPTNPCYVKATHRTDYLGSMSRLYYMANTKTKFTYSSASNDDGFANVPLDSSGAVTQTNGGSNSIIIATNAKSGYTLLYIVRSGLWMMISHKEFYVDRQIGAGFSASTSVNLNIGTSWASSPLVDNIQCLDFINAAAVQAMTQKNVHQFKQAAFNPTQLLGHLSIAFNPATWIALTTVTCGAGNQISELEFGVKEAGTQLSVQGNYDSISKITFSYSPNTVNLFASYVTKYETTYSVAGQAHLVFDQLCVNNGIAWNQPSLSTCTGIARTTLDASLNRLFKDETTLNTYWMFNSTTVTLPPADSATSVCMAPDAFTLTQPAVLYLEYDVSLLPYKLKQSILVTHSTWIDSTQSVNILHLNQDFSLNQTTSFSSSLFHFTMPNIAGNAGTNITRYFLTMHRQCTSIVTTLTTHAQFLAGVTIANSPLAPKFQQVNLRYSQCSSETFTGKTSLVFYQKRSNVTFISVMESNVANLLNPPADPLCSVKEWYVSDLVTTTKLLNTDPVAIKLQQPFRANTMDPLQIDVQHPSGFADIHVQFRVQVYIRGDSTQQFLGILHSQAASVDVYIGCYSLLSIGVRQITTPTYLEFSSYTASSSELLITYASTSFPSTGTIDLSTMIEFFTEVSECGAFQLFSYSDSAYSTQTTTSNPLYMTTNPVVQSSVNGSLVQNVQYNIGASQLFPVTVYLKVETNGLGATVQSKKFKLIVNSLLTCIDQPLPFNSSAMYVVITQNVTLTTLFNNTVTNSKCQGELFYISSTATGSSQNLAGLSISVNNVLFISSGITVQKFFVIMQNILSLNIGAQEFELNQLPAFSTNLKAVHKIQVTRDIEDKLVENTDYQYLSPKLADAEGHQLKMQVDGYSLSDDFIQITISATNNSLTITVHRDKVTETGTYNATLTFGDEHFPQGKSTTLSIQINFINKSSSTYVPAFVPTFVIPKIELNETNESEKKKENALVIEIIETIEVQGKEDIAESILDILLKLGFKFHEGIGLIFPGFTKEYLASVLRNVANNKRERKFYPEPDLTITSVSTSGRFSFLFNQPMLIPSIIDHEMYAKIINLSINPALSDGNIEIIGQYVWNHTEYNDTRRLEDSNSVDQQDFMQGLVFNFSVVNQTKERIDFIIDFESEEYVSSYLTKDILQIDMLSPQIFRSALNLKPLDFGNINEEHVRIKKHIPPQMAKQAQEAISKSIEQYQFIFKVLMSQSGFLALFMQASLHSLFGLIRAIQLIIFSSLIQIPFPAHAFMFLGQMMSMAQVDPFDGAVTYQQWFTFKKTEPVNPNFLANSSDSNFIHNSGSYFIIQVFLIFGLLISYIVNRLMVSHPRGRICRKIGIKVFYPDYQMQLYNVSATLYMETYFDMCLGVMIGLHAFSKYSLGDFFTTKADIFCSLLTLLFAAIHISFTIFIYWFINKSYHNPKQKTIKKYSQVFLQNCHGKTLPSTMYEVYFINRRFWIIFIIIFVQRFPQFQVMFYLIFSFINLPYLISGKPMKGKVANRIEIFNEVCINLCSYIMMIISNPAATNSKSKNALGWIIIAIVCLSIFVNMSRNLLCSLIDMKQKWIVLRSKRKEIAMIKSKFKESDTKFFFPDNFKHFETEKQLLEAEQFIESWRPQREWITVNGLDVTTFKQESNYQEYLYKKKVYKKAELISKLYHLVKTKNQEDVKKPLKPQQQIKQQNYNNQNQQLQQWCSKVSKSNRHQSVKASAIQLVESEVKSPEAKKPNRMSILYSRLNKFKNFTSNHNVQELGIILEQPEQDNLQTISNANSFEGLGKKNKQQSLKQINLESPGLIRPLKIKTNQQGKSVKTLMSNKNTDKNFSDFLHSFQVQSKECSQSSRSRKSKSKGKRKTHNVKLTSTRNLNTDKLEIIHEQPMKDKNKKAKSFNLLKEPAIAKPKILKSKTALKKKEKQLQTLNVNNIDFLEKPRRKKNKKGIYKNLAYSVLKPLLELEILQEAFMNIEEFSSSQPYCSELKKMIFDKKSGRSICIKNIKQMIGEDQSQTFEGYNKAMHMMNNLFAKLISEMKTMENKTLLHLFQENLQVQVDYNIYCFNCNQRTKLKLAKTIVKKSELINPNLMLDNQLCPKCKRTTSANCNGFYKLPMLIAIEPEDTGNESPKHETITQNMSLPVVKQNKNNRVDVVYMQEFSLFAIIIQQKTWYEVAIFHRKTQMWRLYSKGSVSQMTKEEVLNSHSPLLLLYQELSMLQNNCGFFNQLTNE